MNGRRGISSCLVVMCGTIHREGIEKIGLGNFLDRSVFSKIQHQHFLIIVRAFFCTKKYLFCTYGERTGSDDKANSTSSCFRLFLFAFLCLVSRQQGYVWTNLLSGIGPTTAINGLRMVHLLTKPFSILFFLPI